MEVPVSAPGQEEPPPTTTTKKERDPGWKKVTLSAFRENPVIYAENPMASTKNVARTNPLVGPSHRV